MRNEPDNSDIKYKIYVMKGHLDIQIITFICKNVIGIYKIIPNYAVIKDLRF